MDTRLLAAWIRKTADKAERYSLRPVVGQSIASHEVESWELGKNADFGKLAEEMRDAAQLDANAVGSGTYAYAVCAMSAEHVVQRRIFRVFASDETEVVGPNEQANAAGVLAQLMRHVEARERLNTAGELRILDRFARLLDERDKRVTELENKHLEMLRLHEELSSRKHAREVEIIQTQASVEQKNKFVDKTLSLMPHAAAMMGFTAPAGDPEVAQLVEAIVKNEVNLDPILALLPPDAQLPLASIFKRYIDMKTKEKNGKVESNGSRN
ncbi:MAG: hypothetical protein IPK82_23305 [Polyangiaceae bacterium]|nr:hypothetical protein [Polyangiaceae bacterium]